jgi:hypothetical protein
LLVIIEPQPQPTELLSKDAVLLPQDVDDLELAGVAPARHAQDQKPSGSVPIAAMVARPVIDVAVQRAMTTLGDASRFRQPTFGT